ncbi:MAG: polyprenyl synthetase family protein [Candidatus Velamenicoccus archaeovorus]
MDEPQVVAPPALREVRERIEPVLEAFLSERERRMEALDPRSARLVREIRQLVDAGGKRIRPAFCYWGHRAAGGPAGPSIDRAAAAMELFHTFALIHDDVMDESPQRRGAPTVHVRMAEEGPAAALGASERERFGRSGAILVGDLAAVLADELLVDSGFGSGRLVQALRRYAQMRIEVAAGQFLDIADPPRDRASALRVAALKTGAYTVEGPLHVGALLAGGSPPVLAALTAYARPLGEAFQLRDDVLDRGEGSVPGASVATVDGLIDRAAVALATPCLEPQAVAALRSLAEALRL